MEIADNIGRVVREFRESHRLSRNALAKLVEEKSGHRLSSSTLFDIESGKGGTLKTLARVAAAIGVDLGHLCGLPDPGERPTG